MENDGVINFYTGFLTLEIFETVFEFLNPGASGENINYKSSSTESSENKSGGKPQALKPKRLRQGFPVEHISHWCGIHQSTVSRIVTSWINFMYLKFSAICVWPSKEQIDKHMPEEFKEKNPNTRVIIDCTEIKCQMPSSLLLNNQLYSSYKNHTTLKSLIVITPGEALVSSVNSTTAAFLIVRLWSAAGFLTNHLILETRLWLIKDSLCRIYSLLEFL